MTSSTTIYYNMGKLSNPFSALGEVPDCSMLCFPGEWVSHKVRNVVFFFQIYQHQYIQIDWGKALMRAFSYSALS